MSGYTDHVVLRHGILEGELNFLEKPFSADRLAAKVRDALAAAWAAAARIALGRSGGMADAEDLKSSA